MADEIRLIRKQVQLSEASKEPMQSRKRRVSSSAEDISAAKRKRVAQPHQKNTVMEDCELDRLRAIFATPKPSHQPFDPSSFVTPDQLFGNIKRGVQFHSPVSRTAQRKTPSGVAAPKILKAIQLPLRVEMQWQSCHEGVFVFTAEPVKATKQRRKKAVGSAKASRKTRNRIRARSARGAAKARSQEEMPTGRQTRSGKRKAPDSDATLPVKKACVAQEPEPKVPQPAVRRSARHAKTAVSDLVVEETTRSTRKKAADFAKPEIVQPPFQVTVRRSARGKAPTPTDTLLEHPVTRQTRRRPEVPAVNNKKATTPTNIPLEFPATRQTKSRGPVTEVPVAQVAAPSTRSTRQKKAAAEVVSEEQHTSQSMNRVGSKWSPEENKTPLKVKEAASSGTTPLVRRSERLAKKYNHMQA